MDELLNSLQGKFKGEVQTAGNVLEKFSVDTSIFRVTPQVVVSPTDSADLQTLVTWVAGQKKSNPNISLTGRSAGTDMTGGPLNESIIVDFLAHFNHVVEIGGDYCVVEPGVYFRDLEAQLDTKGLLFPSYPASRLLCALGGMIANDAGGEKTLQYGKTDKFVEELNVILADGKEYLIKPLNKEALQAKTAQQDFEGKIYARVSELLAKNADVIAKSRPQVSKNSSGYNIWDAWSEDTFDLNKLIVGSQGTLCLVTKIKLKLVPKEKLEKLYVIFIRDESKMPEFTNEVLALKPTSLEITDDHTLKIYLKYAREMAEVLGAHGIVAFAKLFLPEAIMVLTGGMPKLILLVQFEGDSEEELAQKIVDLGNIVKKYKLKGRYVKSKIEEEKYWKLRRDTFKLLREKVKGVYPTPFIDDLIVKPGDLPEFIPKMTKILDDNKVNFTISGHLGDGNLHIIPLMDIKSDIERQKIMTVRDLVYNLVLEYHGSLSAEHNDGLIRGDWLEKEFGPEVFAIFKQIKEIFDPQDIFNPHKKTDSNADYAKSKMRTS